MQFRKGHARLSVIEAVDNLSNMAELDLDLPQRPLEESKDEMPALSWKDPVYYSYNRERVKETLTILLKYLQDLYEKDSGQLRDVELQRGIQALMLLVSEAAQKIDTHTEMFKAEKGASVTELKEYKALQHFYLTKIVQRFHALMEVEEKWRQEWGSTEKGEEGLSNLETVREDLDYELFLVRQEDNRPFFTRALLRHLQMVGQFESFLVETATEDPLQRIQIALDRGMHDSAKEILSLASVYMDSYFQEAMKFKQREFVTAVNKAIMALMLAANPRNLRQSTLGKSAMDYYADFHLYLRQALASGEYRRFLEKPPQLTDRFLHTLMNLSHVLCSSFFLRAGPRKEMIALIHLLIEKGAEGSKIEKQTASPLSLWNNLLDDDSSIRYLLKQYPNGPLMKTLHLFQEDNELSGFNPIIQQNLTGQMYTIAGSDLHISCVRMPSPTEQERIAKAEIVDEFRNFIQSLQGANKQQRYLMINLQDRTSWKEHARCIAVEEAPQDSDLSGGLIVATLPKNADFYMQSGTYLTLNDAQEFMKHFEEQIESAESCGFHFPKGIKRQQILKFAKEAMKTIHQVFFAGNAVLLHKNRLDFIEIFYLMFVLKLIELVKPDIISFTCKDAIDTGAAASAELFAYLRMMNDPSHWSKEEKDFILWMLYSPALSVRERAIDPLRLSRMASALAIIHGELEAHYEATIKACSKLYEKPFFKGLSVKEAA